MLPSISLAAVTPLLPRHPAFSVARPTMTIIAPSTPTTARHLHFAANSMPTSHTPRTSHQHYQRHHSLHPLHRARKQCCRCPTHGCRLFCPTPRPTAHQCVTPTPRCRLRWLCNGSRTAWQHFRTSCTRHVIVVYIDEDIEIDADKVDEGVRLAKAALAIEHIGHRSLDKC